MISTGRRLVVMRHAKAEAFAADDHARVLTDRGRRDAVEGGLWLSAQGIEPDHVFVSSAMRTVGTWEALSHGLRSSAEVVIQDALYTAGPEATLEVLRSAPLDAQVVFLIGHSPTVAYLAHVLDDGLPEEAAFREMSEGYPTAAMTVLDVRVGWAELAEGAAHISAFHVGRGSATAPLASE